MTDRLKILRSSQASFTCAKPMADGLLSQTGLGVMMGDDFRQSLGARCRPVLKNLGDVGMQLPPATLKQAHIRRVLDEGMLEDVGRIRRNTAAEDKFG